MSEIMKTDEEKYIIERLILTGDITGLKPEEKVKYYNMFCETLGLNPVTQPFDIIRLQGKERLYAKKECTEQLRKIQGVSVIEMKKEFSYDLYVVEVKVQDKTGRIDIATGALNVKGFVGEGLANAIMKCETKAKRRATLSICGLGILDETELETVPDTINDTENILKDVSRKAKEDLPPKQVINFTDKEEISREILFKMAYDYKDLINDKEKLFFSNLRKDIDIKRPYTKEQFIKDRSYVESIIDRLDKGASEAFDNPELTDENDPIPEFLTEDEKKQDDLPVGVL